MITKYLIPLCVATAMLVACGHREDGQSGTYSQGPNGTGTAADSAADPAATPGTGDTATTPGGNAGDPSTTPPNTTSSPDPSGG
jgi:hypothetical protein